MTINYLSDDMDAHGVMSSTAPLPYDINTPSEPDDAISPDHLA